MDRPEIRRIGLSDLRQALRLGWADFITAPTQLVFLCILYPVIGLIAGKLAAGGDAMHLLYPMAMGFALVGPVAALGLYEISRRREQGLPATWRNAFDVFHAPAFGPIVALGMILVAVFLLWLWIADLIFAATIGTLPTSVDFWTALTETSEGRRLMVWGNLIGFVFAVAVLVMTAISFPMLLDRDVSLGRAVATSARAFLVNPVTMCVWGAIVGVLLLLGSLPLFIGLAIVLPVLGHATWHLYRQVVV